jgi:hypothetical protein
MDIHKESSLDIFGCEAAEARGHEVSERKHKAEENTYWTSSNTTLLGWYILNSLTTVASTVEKNITS